MGSVSINKFNEEIDIFDVKFRIIYQPTNNFAFDLNVCLCIFFANIFAHHECYYDHPIFSFL